MEGSVGGTSVKSCHQLAVIRATWRLALIVANLSLTGCEATGNAKGADGAAGFTGDTTACEFPGGHGRGTGRWLHSGERQASRFPLSQFANVFSRTPSLPARVRCRKPRSSRLRRMWSPSVLTSRG